MIDILKPKKVAVPHIDALHGHTVIELTDVKTGKRDRIESDNVVTDGLESHLRNFGPVVNCRLVSAERNKERFAPYFGGLFLFDQSIPTTSRYMPAGTKMVGNGSYKVSNSGVLTEMGSYNEIESHASQNSFTQVYDFSTQQANGVIGSACLTTDVGGYVGYGFSSEQTLSTKKRPIDLYTYDEQTNDSSFSSYLTWVYKNFAYYANHVNKTATEITVYKKNFPIDELSDFSGILRTGSLPTSAEALTFNITAPGYSMAWVASDSKLFMVPGNWDSPYRISAGGTFPIKILDLDTEQLTESTFTNTTGVELKCVVDLTNPITLDGSGMFFVGSSDNKLYVLNTSTGAFTATNLTVSSFYTDRMDISRYTDTLFRYAYDDEFSGIIDPVNLTMYPTNEVLSARVINNRGLSYSYDHDCFIGWSKPSYYETFALPNHLRLMTINNLSTPVTKDATKTMKVSYTISVE